IAGAGARPRAVSQRATRSRESGMGVRLRHAAAARAPARCPAPCTLGLVRPGDHDGRAAAPVQRLHTALSAAIRSRSARRFRFEQAAARADLRRDATREFVSYRRYLFRRCPGTAANDAGHGSPDRARLEATETG